jgi:hypothetical protein
MLRTLPPFQTHHLRLSAFDDSTFRSSSRAQDISQLMMVTQYRLKQTFMLLALAAAFGADYAWARWALTNRISAPVSHPHR